MSIRLVILRLYVNGIRRPEGVVTPPADVILKHPVEVRENPVIVALAVRSVALKAPPHRLAVEGDSGVAVCAVIIDNFAKIRIGLIRMTRPRPI